jgi:hypothetical protein
VKVNIKRVPVLENTFSGVAGESKVTAELLRCGFRIAKPLWTDNEVDLILLYPLDDGAVFPIPIQVKSVQFYSRSGRLYKTRQMNKLKKRYVENNHALCVAIYRPDLDCIWFIDGPDNIKAVHNKYAKVPYDALDKKKSNLSIRLTAVNCPLDEDWLAPKDNAKWWSERLFRLASDLVSQNRLTAQVDAFFDLMPEDEESEEDSVPSQAPSAHPYDETAKG